MSLIEELTELRKTNPSAGYLDLRPEIKELMEKLGKNTKVHMENEWADHIKRNMHLIDQDHSLGKLEHYGQNKSCIIVGASPALKKNVNALKLIEGKFRDRFILITVNSAVEFLVNNGIIPDFVIAVDSDREVWQRDLSKVNDKKLSLICSPFLHPDAVKNWKGRIIFIPMGCTDENVQNEVVKKLGATQPIPGCGNAFNEAILIAYMVFDCRNYVFVGNELSWPIGGKYYVDGKHSNDEENKDITKCVAMDIYGNAVTTTPGHWAFKTWTEDLASKAHGVFINATEGGILGMSVKDGRLPWIKQFYLDKAITYIKQIYEDAEDWRFVESMKYNLAWLRGYDCMGVPNPLMIKSLRPRNILDVGCGGGATVDELVKMGYDAYGIDMAEVAARKWNGANRCYLAFADSIPADDNSFDLAMTDILEHIPEEHVRKVIKEIARVSKKQMFNIEYEGARWLIDSRIEPHCIIKPPDWWKKQLKQCGLRITATSGTRTLITEKRS